MTILPQLRDALTRSRPPLILPELRDGLVGARAPERARRRRRRRPVVVGFVAMSGLLATAGALAATGVLPIGAPVEPHHVERNPAHGLGVPVDSSARLLPLRVEDPAGGPPWGLRMVATSRGMACLQLGRVVENQLGVLGQDGLAGDDGRFHPLPTATASSPLTPCLLPDGAGRFYTGMEKPTYASGENGERSCRPAGERPNGRPACPAADLRRVAYGLLGPQAARITFVDGTKLELTGPDGAYLYVSDVVRDNDGLAFGGGPAIGEFGAVRRIDYRDGTSCPSGSKKLAFCAPRGYVKRTGTKGTASMRRALHVTYGQRKIGKRRFPEVRVSFRAPAAIADAGQMYLLQGRFPDSKDKLCRHVVIYAPSSRNLRKDDRVKLVGMVPPGCTGRLEASVLLADISFHNGKPPAATVGRISHDFP